MAQSAEQAIRVTARGEFGQLQRGLKSLQGDLKDVLGEINKGARKGGFFDDSSMRALELFKNRFKGTMEELNKEFEKQNSVIDKLYEKMKKGNSYQKWEIEQIIKKKEKELDVMRKQIIEMEKLYDKRTKEASGYTVNAPDSSGAFEYEHSLIYDSYLFNTLA
jgi:hypothetical protein